MTPRRRFTPEDLLVVRRSDGPPDLWAMTSTQYRDDDAMAPFVKDVLRPKNVETLASGVLDLVERGFVVIGPHQHRERKGWDAGRIEMSDRVRVAPVVDLAYVKRDRCGIHFGEPFEDEPDWQTVGRPSGHDV